MSTTFLRLDEALEYIIDHLHLHHEIERHLKAMEVRSYSTSPPPLHAFQSSDVDGDDDDLREYLLNAVDEDEQDNGGIQEMLMYVIVH